MALTFQQIIQKLTQFWQSKGCIIHQGHDLEMGAGTFNPATFLRALGPEPYQAAYVEPSRRPSDGRYGDNPNRVQLFHQFQVLLKPSPEDVLESYLDSLRALGFDLKKHDIRFVHDDWESPTIGAWGLGWEVWCDGMEITQFTYFQAVASLPLSPISAEITYGLERLALFIQNKESIFDVLWDEKHTLREIIHHNEVEWSSYNFTHASTSMWLKHFEDYEKEAKALVDQHLSIPAYDFIVKGSHAFNLLDARGAISVAERASYIGRIRELARLVGGEYIAKREALGFPLLPPKKEKKKQPLRIPTVRYNPKKSQDFLLEIGSEPLPATFVPIGCHQLQKGIEAFLKKHSLQPKNIHVFGTPERLSVLVTNLPEGTSSTSKQRKGPSLTAAFATTGTPTAQGAGFLKSVQQPPTITLAEIRANKVPGLFIEGDHLCALWEEKGVSSFALLAEHLPKIILGLDFPKKMQWTDPPITYARPIRWLVALFGERIIPFEIGNVRSGRLAKGHSQLCPKLFPISSPNRYLSSLRKHYVLADTEERKQSILKQLHQIEKKCKGVALSIEQVLPQVLHLTQWPRLTSATFDPSFLKIPKEILICEMVEHQKYFPIANTEGELKNTFIITADNAPNTLIRKGNQKVLSARLSDGAFLYKEDLQISLEKRNEQLQQMTHLKGLGSMWDKVCRLRTLSHLVNQHLQLADTPTLERAAKLCKADLASLLVREFPELQGNIGKYYALAQGETKQVASAIEEHWMPNAESAPLPHTPAGIILSIADKVDNLLSCYCMHLKPTSSSDPYALRRQGIGIIKILLQEKKSLDLNLLLHSALSSFPMAQGMENALVQEILPFLTARLKGVLEELGFRKNVIEATLHCPQDPYDQFRRTEALHTFCQSGPSWERLCEVYKRAKGQLSQVALASLNPTLATEPAEQALMKTLHILQSKWDDVLAKKDYLQALHLMAQLQPPLANLFDSVKILADDPAIRANRIALLHQVFSYFTQLIDFQKIAL